MSNFYMRIFHKWNDMQTLQKTSESVVIVNATCFVYLIRHSIILSLVSTRYFVKIRNTDSQLLFINRNELVLFEYRRCSCVCVCVCASVSFRFRCYFCVQWFRGKMFLFISRRASVLIRSDLMLVEKFYGHFKPSTMIGHIEAQKLKINLISKLWCAVNERRMNLINVMLVFQFPFFRSSHSSLSKIPDIIWISRTLAAFKPWIYVLPLCILMWWKAIAEKSPFVNGNFSQHIWRFFENVDNKSISDIFRHFFLLNHIQNRMILKVTEKKKKRIYF